MLFWKNSREQLELMKTKKKRGSTGFDSDTSGHGASEEEESSSDTEGPPNDSDETNETNDTDGVDIDYALANERERQRLEKLPKCLHVGRQFAEECNVDVERHNARCFVKTLKGELVPMLLQLRSNIEIDGALQNFASEYCQSKYKFEFNSHVNPNSYLFIYKQFFIVIVSGVFSMQQKMQNQNDSSDSYTLMTIMNADGIYLATYAALLLNLKLIRLNYYEDEMKKVPISEVQIVLFFPLQKKKTFLYFHSFF